MFKMKSRVLEAIRNFLEREAVVGTGIVAVSGGADSVALLRALYGRPLVVAHANHGLRGAESDGDEAFVRELAAEMKLEFRSVRLAIPANENLESAARRLRYDWLARLANEVNASWIATGHTADDQAETVLHRIVRGTGLQGLRGIASDKIIDNVKIIRPLLATTRDDVISYLADLGQTHRTDSSNADRRFTRNRIRHELLPQLKEFNPEIVAVLGRLAEHSTEAFEFIEGEAKQLLARVERPRAGAKLIFDKSTLESATPFLVREIFRLVWQREGWPMDAMTSEHWQRVANFTAGDYPGCVKLLAVGQIVQVGRG